MSRILSLPFALGTCLISIAALAAPMPQRVRGTIASVSSTALTVNTMSGADVTVALTGQTRYLKLAPSSLAYVDPGSYIGTATKRIGNQLIALEVVVFPPKLRGTGEGHYAWDRIPDTTLSGRAVTSSSMTNGTVTATTPSGTPSTVNSTMTNGTVSGTGNAQGVKQITVTYKGGQQTILVPPTAPIVNYWAGDKAELKPGAAVFVNALHDGDALTARAVAMGIDGAKPPM
jgi:hypothetical protein